MIIDIPKQNPWKQVNKGDLAGSIWSSRNIDLKKKEGYVSPTHKMLVTTLSGDTDNPTDLAVGFCKERGTVGPFNDIRWWTAAGTSVYESTSENGDFEVDDSGTLPTTSGKSEVDMVAFNGNVYIAYNDTLYKRNGTTWTSVSTALELGKKILCVYGDRLYIAGDENVVSINTDDLLATTSNTLNLQTASNENLKISCIRRTSNGLWIGTSNYQGGRAKMFFWDGETEDTVETAKSLESGMAMAMTIKDNIPYVLDNRLVLSAYNGSYFAEVARMDNDQKHLYRFNDTGDNDRWIHPNGMQTIDDEILMAINTRPEDTDDAQPIRMPAGVYAYNPDYGIYHKFSFTSQRDSATVVDQGQVQVEEVGGLFSLFDDGENDERVDQSDFFVGFAYKSDNSTTKYAIAKTDKRGLDKVQAEAGVIITTKITAEEVQETWEKFYLFIRQFRNSTDKIVVKYRTREHIPTYVPKEVDITWINTTSFSSTDADMAYIYDLFNDSTSIDIDFEVEGLQGDGAGYLSHVTEISEISGTYYVTVDETITGATTNTARVRFDVWNKIGEFKHTSSDLISSDLFKEFNPEAVSTWIQFKIYMLGQDIQLERILSKSSITQEL